MADPVVQDPAAPPVPAAPAAPTPAPEPRTTIDPKLFEAERTERLRLARENEELSARIKKSEDAAAEVERKRLEEDGNYKAIAEQERQRREAAEATITERERAIGERIVNTELRVALVNAGAKDPDLVALLDRSAVKVEADGSVSGASAAVEALKAAKPALFGVAPATPTHTPPAPARPGAAPELTNVRDLHGDKYEEAKATALGRYGAHYRARVGTRRNRMG